MITATSERVKKGRENAQECREKIAGLLLKYECSLTIYSDDWDEEIVVYDNETLEEADGGL